MVKSNKALRILVFCNRPEEKADASTIVEHVDAFKKHSVHKVEILSSLNGLPSDPVLAGFDCLVIHYSISFLSERYVSRSCLEKIRQFKGLKIAFLQDEYRRVNFMCLNLSYAGIHLIYSCAPIDVARRIYRSLLPNVEIRTTLTGYVADQQFLEKNYPPYKDRQIDVGYRARKLPFFLGKKGFEKFMIGEEFLNRTSSANLRINISSKEKDRIYGNAWRKFLENSKATLGTESGSSIVDFSGEIEFQLCRFQAFHPMANFNDAPKKWLRKDGDLEIQVISPRCFEAASLGTAMIMFPGTYSGILTPFKHYLPLEKDFSNLSEVLKKMKDNEFMQEMIDRTFNDLILSGRYSYKTLVSQFDSDLQQLIQKQGYSPLESTNILSSKKNILNKFRETESKKTILGAFRSYFSQLFKNLPEWIRFLMIMTIFRRKYFSHLYPETWKHLNDLELGK